MFFADWMKVIVSLYVKLCYQSAMKSTVLWGSDWINANIKCYQGRLSSGYFTFEPSNWNAPLWPVEHRNHTHAFSQSVSNTSFAVQCVLEFYSGVVIKKSHLNGASVCVKGARFYRHGQWNIPIRFSWNHLHINSEMNKNMSAFTVLGVLCEIVFFCTFCIFSV